MLKSNPSSSRANRIPLVLTFKKHYQILKKSLINIGVYFKLILNTIKSLKKIIVNGRNRNLCKLIRSNQQFIRTKPYQIVKTLKSFHQYVGNRKVAFKLLLKNRRKGTKAKKRKKTVLACKQFQISNHNFPTGREKTLGF